MLKKNLKLKRQKKAKNAILNNVFSFYTVSLIPIKNKKISSQNTFYGTKKLHLLRLLMLEPQLMDQLHQQKLDRY